MKKVNVYHEREHRLVGIMIFRQFQLFIKAPKNRTKELFKKSRISNMNGVANFSVEEMIETIAEELEKARSRWGSGVEDITSPNITAETIVSKMLSKELDLISKKKNYYSYSNKDFAYFDKHILPSAYSYEFPDQLEKKIEDYQLDKQYMVKYFLLTASIPNVVPPAKAISTEYVWDVIRMKAAAMDQLIKEADKALKIRELLDRVYEEGNNADVTAYRIRQQLSGNPVNLGNVTINDVKGAIREEFKENG
jgi:hypothetical protein